jgi:hypothetical protein
MSNYWRVLSPLHATVTKRESHATGGLVGQGYKKGGKVKGDRPRPQGPHMWVRKKKAEGGKADKNWIQKATASIKRRKTEGKCTPITKKGCTGRAKALAKTFKKMAKKRKAA